LVWRAEAGSLDVRTPEASQRSGVIGVGAAFDFHTGRVRGTGVMRDHGFECSSGWP